MWTTSDTLALVLGLMLGIPALVGGLVAALRWGCPDRYKSLKRRVNKCCDINNDQPKNDANDNGKVTDKKNNQPQDNVDGNVQGKDKKDNPGNQSINQSINQPITVHVNVTAARTSKDDARHPGTTGTADQGGIKIAEDPVTEPILSPQTADKNNDQPNNDANDNGKVTGTAEDPKDTEPLLSQQTAEKPSAPIDDKLSLQVHPVKIHQEDTIAIPISDDVDSSGGAETNPGTAEDPRDTEPLLSPQTAEKPSVPIDDELQVHPVEIHQEAQGLAMDLAADFINYKMALEGKPCNDTALNLRKQGDFINYKNELEGNPCNDTVLTLRKAGDEMILKIDADEQFRNVLEKLDFSLENGYGQFESLVDSMLEEGEVNWGCIVMVFVVGAKLALMKYNDKDYIIDCTGNLIHRKFSKWITENGGWDSLHNLNIDTVQSSLSRPLHKILSWFSFPI